MQRSPRWRSIGVPVSYDRRIYFADVPEAESRRRSIRAAFIAGLCNVVFVVPLILDVYRGWNSIALSYPGILFVCIYLAPLLVVIIGRQIVQITYTYAVMLSVLLVVGLGQHPLAFLANLLMLVLGGASAFFLLVLAAQNLETAATNAWKRRRGSNADVSGP